MTRLTIEQLEQRAGRGSSQPWVARASDGARYVVKFRGAGPGPYALVAEMAVNALAARWGYPVPEARPVWLDASTPRVGTDEFWGVMDRSYGWNLGIRWFPDAHDVALDGSAELPGAVLNALVVIDRLFANFDRTDISNNLIRDAAGAHWLIDHGSCRFLDRLAGPPFAFELAPNHFLRAANAPFTAPPRLADHDLRAALIALPEDWLQPIAVPRERLIAGLTRRIEAFCEG